MAPVHCAAGSDGDTNFGVTSLAAPNAASSSLARYSLVARSTACASSSLFHFEPGVDRCLFASATIRLASTANPSPLSSRACAHASRPLVSLARLGNENCQKEQRQVCQGCARPQARRDLASHVDRSNRVLLENNGAGTRSSS